MPTTQHRPHGAYAGPVFGDLSGKTEDTTPPAEPPKTQHRPHGAFAGPLYGTLSGKTAADPGGGFTLEAPLTAALAGTFSAAGSIALGMNYAGSAALSATFGASGEFEFGVSGDPTVTIRLRDAEVSGDLLPGLTSVEWAWWDSATKASETWGVAPTGGGLSEVSDGAAEMVLTLTGSAKTSGQQILAELYFDEPNPRTFKALLTVD